MREGARCQKIEIVLDERDATRRALDMGRKGDLVVLCVDHANLAWNEVQHRLHGTPEDGAMGDPETDGVELVAEIDAEDFF